ncbi:hypothetical protein DWH65_25605 [Escherichia coli]|nr:hypothetical protein [Escherichia coli]EEW8308932.1 hypothetical protein [Escherichia coli]EEX0331674.1 hypothetical protein [Escherichia coli]EFA5452240.1 hypothetical protein [Escherichia coli]EFN3788830.1 hypothetical protein [Escherichia coli]
MYQKPCVLSVYFYLHTIHSLYSPYFKDTFLNAFQINNLSISFKFCCWIFCIKCTFSHSVSDPSDFNRLAKSCRIL